MREEHLHVADEQLLLHAGGELGASSSGQIRAHLEGCTRCRERLMALESTLAEYGEAHRKNWETELPAAAGPRALLQARLAELTAGERGNGWLGSRWLAGIERHQTMVLAGVVMVACLLLGMTLWQSKLGQIGAKQVGAKQVGAKQISVKQPVERAESVVAALGHGEEPDLRLTPGAIVPVTASEVCGAAATKREPVVPVSLKRKVFEEYGVTPRQPDAYEVDYLITPELGGATDIRNLWPEPYQDTVWNAHVKDQLEDRLHRMVCRGDLDLATAQRDISTDWIAAYRKYFHAEKPVADNSSSNLSNFSSLPRT
jgi:anti-sigma factor RsiW